MLTRVLCCVSLPLSLPQLGVTWTPVYNRTDNALVRKNHRAILIPSSGEWDFLLLGGDNAGYLNDVWSVPHSMRSSQGESCSVSSCV